MRGVRDCLLTALEPPLVQGPLHGRVGICGRWGDGLLVVASLHSQRSAARRQIRGRWSIMSAARALCCVSRVGEFAVSTVFSSDLFSHVCVSAHCTLRARGLNANHATRAHTHAHTPRAHADLSHTRSRPHLRGRHMTTCGAVARRTRHAGRALRGRHPGARPLPASPRAVRARFSRGLARPHM